MLIIALLALGVGLAASISERKRLQAMRFDINRPNFLKPQAD